MLDLDRLIAYVAKSPLTPKNTEGIKADPPKIFSSTTPAVLMGLDGAAIWSPIQNLDPKFAVNTNWDLFEHTPSATLLSSLQRFLVAGQGRGGPVVRRRQVARQLQQAARRRIGRTSRRPYQERSSIPRARPRCSSAPSARSRSRLTGQPSYLVVEGVRTLLWVNNTESDLFRMGRTGDFYFLVAGRWFKAASLGNVST